VVSPAQFLGLNENVGGYDQDANYTASNETGEAHAIKDACEFGNEQVLSFPMKGDLLAVDSINTRHYASEAVALSDCDIILLPFKKLTGLCQTHPALEILCTAS
jgi:CRP-like cAMP-binding protein